MLYAVTTEAKAEILEAVAVLGLMMTALLIIALIADSKQAGAQGHCLVRTLKVC